MTYANPTPLRVGARGTLHGWQVTVVGRVVLGVAVDGETYYWNEFILRGDRGNWGTLVYEETEAGPEWKLFREFTPVQPMTAREAAAKRVGDSVNLDGTPTRVTLTGTSRVYHIEGQAPEGTEVGDIASYFNADTGPRMLVVSWTGDEIEFYEGQDAPAALVARAFQLEPSAAAFRVPGTSASRAPGTSGRYTKVVIGIFILAAVFVGVMTLTSSRRSRSAVVSTAPKPLPTLQLAQGAQGKLGLESFTITGASTVEIARVKGRQHRREYQLVGDGTERRFLIQGLTGNAKEWHLLRPLATPPPFDPYEAAALRSGSYLTVGAQKARIAELFQAKTLTTDGATESLPVRGAVRYGFLAQQASDWVIARWDESGIQYHVATQFAESDILAAFVGPEAQKK